MNSVTKFLLQQAIKRPVATTEAGAKKFLSLAKDAFANVKSGKFDSDSVKEWDAATVSMNRPIHLIMQGNFAQLEQEGYSDIVKAAGMAGLFTKSQMGPGQFPMQRENTYANFYDELAVDTDWMPCMRMVDASGSTAIVDVDFDSKVLVEQIQDGDELPAAKFGQETETLIYGDRFGVMVNMPQRWLDTNGVYSINSVAEAIRKAFIKKKADDAYSKLGDNTGITATTSAGSTLADRITAFNAGFVTLVTKLAGNGYNISANQGVYIVANLQVRDEVNQMLRTEIGSETTNGILETPVLGAIYTLNSGVDVQPNGSKNGFYIVAPGFRNRVIQFKGNMQQSQYNFWTDSNKIGAQEYWKMDAPAVQRQIINLDA